MDWRRMFCLPPKRWRPPPPPPVARARTTQSAVRMQQRRQEQLRREGMGTMTSADSTAIEMTDAQIREAVRGVVGERGRQGSGALSARSTLSQLQADDFPSYTQEGGPMPQVPPRSMQPRGPSIDGMANIKEATSQDERGSGDSFGGYKRKAISPDAMPLGGGKSSSIGKVMASGDGRRNTSLGGVSLGQRDGGSSRNSDGQRPPPLGSPALKRINTSSKPNPYAVLSENGALRNTIARLRQDMADMRRQLIDAEQKVERAKKARHHLMLYNNIIAAIDANPSTQEKMAGFYQLVSIKRAIVDRARDSFQNSEIVAPKEVSILSTWPTLSPFAQVQPQVQVPLADRPVRAAEDPGPSIKRADTPRPALPDSGPLDKQAEDAARPSGPAGYVQPALPQR